jgi:hypothetical protein
MDADGSTRVFDVTEWLVRRGRDYRVKNDGGGGGASVGEDKEETMVNEWVGL